MSTYLSIFCLSFVIALSGALMPGTLLTAVVAESCGGSVWAGALISVGHALLEGGLLVLIMLGFSGIMRSNPFIGTTTIAGSIFLVYSGIQMLVSLRTIILDQALKRSSSPGRLVVAGITVSATNPYWLVWWITVGLGFALSAQKAGIAGVGAFFCGHITADFLWYSLVSFLIASRRAFISDRVYKIILRCCALVLIGFGIFFLLKLPSLLNK
jgi:threonine/homoserine/homoserine lactone efflux protein